MKTAEIFLSFGRAAQLARVAIYFVQKRSHRLHTFTTKSLGAVFTLSGRACFKIIVICGRWPGSIGLLGANSNAGFQW